MIWLNVAKKEGYFLFEKYIAMWIKIDGSVLGR